ARANRNAPATEIRNGRGWARTYDPTRRIPCTNRPRSCGTCVSTRACIAPPSRLGILRSATPGGVATHDACWNDAAHDRAPAVVRDVARRRSDDTRALPGGLGPFDARGRRRWFPEQRRPRVLRQARFVSGARR